jgi:uncharacterized membrane protein
VTVDVSTSIVIHRPRSHVAAYASRPENAPSWYPNIKGVRRLTSPPLAVGSRIAFTAQFLGRRLEYVYEVVESVPGERLVMRTAEGPFPMETTYYWETTPEGHTRMTLRNRGDPNGLAGVAAPAIALALRGANRRDLARLRTILEQGIRVREYAPGAEAARAG